MVTPDQAAANWQKGLSQATDKIRQGVQAVSVAPTQKAAARADAYQQGVMQAVASGKWQRGLNRVSLQDWQNSTLTKGVPRIASGATQAQPKFASFMQDFLPHVANGVQQLQSMPRGDLNQNIARAVFMMEHNARFQKRS